MTTLILKSQSILAENLSGRLSTGRLIAFAGIVVLLAFPGGTGEAARGAAADAFFQVTTFVSATLLLFYGIEAVFKVDTDAWLDRHARWQVPAAALLGMTPGCGGAIMAMTVYARGRLSFGAVVATLTGTMGDAAFVLLAREPVTALFTFGLSFVVGVVSGYTVDAIHGRGFMRPPRESGGSACASPVVGSMRMADRIWLGLSVPGLAVGIFGLAQIDVGAALGMEAWVLGVGMGGTLLAFLLWALRPAGSDAVCQTPDQGGSSLWARVTDDTAFVSVWVVMAYLVYELGTAWFGFDPGGLFKAWAPLLPLLGVVAGFIPGCGPQIVVTTLYASGLVPYSTLIGNAISNDGDALFPALAIAPKAALAATAYSAVPALVVGYAAYALGY